MKLCVFGAGAIGSLVAARLSAAGADVTLVGRGAQLAAIRARGVTIIDDAGERVVPVRCTDDARAAGRQDYLILTVKAHAVDPALGEIAPLLGPGTAVVTAQNGILWWYFYKLAGPFENRQLESADRGGRIWNALGPERAIGCVVYPSCEVVSPGVIRHLEGERLMLGEPDGARSARVTALGEALAGAGFKAPVRPRIRDDIWFKLLGNATFNPVSVLTGATLEQMGRYEQGRAVIRRMMEEAMAVAAALGVTFPMDVERRIDGAVAVGAHKTSMLQDYEAGRPLELDALVGAVVELGRLVGVPTPAIEMALALVRLRLAAGGGSGVSRDT